MSYSFQRTYLLKQQTPLIHFQYDQEGATLRASEVKPKLDAFIASLYRNDKDFTSWKQSGHDALKYQIHFFTPDETPVISKTHLKDIEFHTISNRTERNRAKRQWENNPANQAETINKMYFANMVKENQPQSEYAKEVEENYKETVFYHKEIKMVVTCMIASLREAIDRCLESFYILYNFGCRQTKGFGGFKLTRKVDNPSWKPSDPVNVIKQSAYPYFYFSANGNMYDLMNHAMTVYAVMKGGLNMTFRNGDGYVKGYAQREYLNDINASQTGSEKAYIKSIMFTNANHPEYNDYLFVRALLGLPDHYDFLHNGENNCTVNVYHLGKDDFDIVRFHSPATISIVDQYVFFWFSDAESILNKTFYLAKDSEVNYDIKRIDQNRMLNGSQKYMKKKELIEARGKAIDTPEAVNWDAFIRGFIAYFHDPDTRHGLFACGQPFSRSSQLRLEVI